MDDLVNVRNAGDRYEITPTPEWEADASTVVAAGIARTENLQPEAVTPPLQAFVDPDALDVLLADADDDVCVQFRAWDYLITVGTDLTVLLRPLHDGESVGQGTTDQQPGEVSRSHS